MTEPTLSVRWRRCALCRGVLSAAAHDRGEWSRNTFGVYVHTFNCLLITPREWRAKRATEATMLAAQREDE